MVIVIDLFRLGLFLIITNFLKNYALRCIRDPSKQLRTFNTISIFSNVILIFLVQVEKDFLLNA